MTRGAGGESLNLDNADLMLVLERPWNPATEEQLEGRVYRPASGKKRMTRIVYVMHKGIDATVRSRVLRRGQLTRGALLKILQAQKEVKLYA
jgi:SNF2 family DNA or RNA helicase